MLQQSEVVSLLLALSLAPVVYASVRNRRFAGKEAFLVAVVAMFLTYIAAILEGYLLAELFNVLEHGSLALSSVAFAIALVQYMRSELQVSQT